LPTVVNIFEQYSAPNLSNGSPSIISSDSLIRVINKWDDGSLLHLIPSRLELSWTLKNPTEKAHLLPRFISTISESYDIIIIDCPPTESILTTAAYRSSRFIFVPVRPEFLATIGLPLLARSISEFQQVHQDQVRCKRPGKDTWVVRF
jgi:chromosome partitioning protein